MLGRSAFAIALGAGFCALALWLIPSGAPALTETPGNDNYLYAFNVNSPATRLNAFQDIRDTAGASLQSNIFDPCLTRTCAIGPEEQSTCHGVRYGRTLWYDFFPDHNGQVEIRTVGIPNVIALYTFDPRTRVPSEVTCASGSSYPSNVLFTTVQRGLDYAYQIGGRANEPGSLKMQFNFAYNRYLAVAPFTAKALVETIGGGRPRLLRLRFIGLTQGESVSAACTSCGKTIFRPGRRHGDITVLSATPPPAISSQMRFLVTGTGPNEIGRFKLYAVDLVDHRVPVVADGCLAPGVTSVTGPAVDNVKLLTSIPCPRTVVRSTGGEYVFWENTLGRLWERRFTRGAWTPRRRLNATKLGSGPSVAVHANGEQDVFWKGRSGSLWETWYTSKWHGPDDFRPAQLGSAPAAGVDTSGDEYVFWQGSDGGLWEKSFSGRSGPIEISQAGKLGSAPAVAVRANGEQDVFWRGTNGNVWEMWYTNSWNGPEDLLGGELGSAPTAGVDAAGNEYVFWQGTDGGLWEKLYLAGEGWLSPREISVAGKIGSAPSVAVHADGQQDVFYRGTDGKLWEAWYTTKWNGPKDLGGGKLNASAAPSAGVYATNQQPPA